jgi:hypothetical protein
VVGHRLVVGCPPAEERGCTGKRLVPNGRFRGETGCEWRSMATRRWCRGAPRLCACPDHRGRTPSEHRHTFFFNRIPPHLGLPIRVKLYLSETAPDHLGPPGSSRSLGRHLCPHAMKQASPLDLAFLFVQAHTCCPLRHPPRPLRSRLLPRKQ